MSLSLGGGSGGEYIPGISNIDSLRAPKGVMASPKWRWDPRTIHWQLQIVPFKSSEVKRTFLQLDQFLFIFIHSTVSQSFQGCNYFYGVILNVKGYPPIPNCVLNFTPCFCNDVSRHHGTQTLISAMMFSFGSWQASTITNTLLTTVTGQVDSPEYKLIGRETTVNNTHCKIQSTQDRVIEQSLAENICSMVP